MKFGRRIKDSRYAEWADYYIAYGALKKQIKSNLPWNDAAEADFIRTLDDELTKCEKFQADKSAEIERQVGTLIKEVAALINRAKAQENQPQHHHQHQNSTPGDIERSVRDHQDEDAGSDDDFEDDEERDDTSIMSVNAIEEEFREYEEAVASLVADVHDLALFTKLNFTGFIKIVKKHDKLTGWTLKPAFNKELLQKHPLHRINYDHLVVKLSALFDKVRTRGNQAEGDSSAGGSQNAFVRSTTKYWVHDDNIVPLKLAIMRHLPVMVFDPKKEFEIKDSAITSIYFDNEDLELYLGRLEKTEGAEAIRIRWYGDVDVKDIFVERKTHREDWTGEKSVKERFRVDEDKVNDFLAGRYTMDAELDALVTRGKKTAKEIENVKQLASEIQYAVITRKLRPVMRTFYNRTAFQLPGNATVRISLDTELSMVREDNFDGKDRTHGNWRRTDFGLDHPFPTVPSNEKELFPYAVLEVKLATKVGEEPPEWIRDLINSHLVEAVPKFSKFIHGCASLLGDRVDLVPFWLPQMEMDIRKPITARSRVLIERPTSHAASTATTSAMHSPGHSGGSYHEPVSEGEDDEEYLVEAATNEDQHLRLPPDAAAQARAARDFREQKLRDEAAANAGSSDGPPPPNTQPPRGPKGKYDPPLRIDPLAPSDRFDTNVSLLDDKSIAKLNNEAKKQRNGGKADHDDDDDDEDEEVDEAEDEQGNRSEFIRTFHAPPGKKISVPVRVEPKVIFAAERTFLRWMHFSVILSAVSITLINFIGVDDQVGLFSAGMFTITALVSIVWAGGMLIYRQRAMAKRRAIEYHDAWGPSVLTLALVASIIVNLALRIKEL
ncbi:putative vacuole fusion, non-autophagic-related protein [Naematelia encephala]|uniref:Vacuolar transporter chaperone complex subunit 4 n=1 Tax=Naematelia encephala TaxID=71784 RepID=A0A1Y2AT39_9TREE|nr:putative vacuole fusion, non-autophagic-related protein [Naematelia encephala]